MRITADHLVLNGEIRANARQWDSPYEPIGAGGSIWLDARLLEGNGRIRADSEDGVDRQARRNGGGGRVALYFDSAPGFDPLGQVSAKGGAGTLPQGGAGTVYVMDRQQQREWVFVDNGPGGDSASPTPITESLDIPLLIGRARVTFPSAIALQDVSFGNALVEQLSSTSVRSIQGSGGKWKLAAPLSLTTPQLDVGAWTLLPQHRQYFTDLNLRDGALVTHEPYSSGDEGAWLWAETISLAPTAKIDVSDLGRTTDGGITDSRNGASHGGLGGVYSGSTNAVFGSSTQPITHGVGGGGSNGNRGGGRVKIEAERVHLHGDVIADGQNGTTGRGGGSGGSAWIIAGSITGNG